MSDTELKKISNDPKLSRKRKKDKKPQLGTVNELFDGFARETSTKSKRGRPWIKNPQEYAKGQLAKKDETQSEASETSSDSEEDEAPEIDLHDLEDANFLSLVQDARRTEEATKRIAILHFDWDNVTVEDIFVLMESFVPGTGHLEKVTIYPSQYGIQKMQEESRQGPDELKVSDSEASEGETLDTTTSKSWKSVSVNTRKRLRKYQLQRLKYFYAVAEFDSVATAAAVYDHCDGFEYQSSGICLDLRFVSDSETFDIDPEHAYLVTECSEVNKSRYQPKKFTTKALSSTRVELGWDKTSDLRTQWLKDQFKREADPKRCLTEEANQLSQYLAMSSSGASTAASSDVDDPGPAPTVPRIRRHRPKKVPADRMRALLLGDSSAKPGSDVSTSGSEEEEVENLQISSDSDEQYDLGEATGKEDARRKEDDEFEDLDFDNMDTRKSDSEFSEQDSDDSDEPTAKQSKKLGHRAKMREKLQKRRQMLNKKASQQQLLWRAEDGMEFAGDNRFDEFLTNPTFKISQTHKNYKDAADFLEFMRHRERSRK